MLIVWGIEPLVFGAQLQVKKPDFRGPLFKKTQSWTDTVWFEIAFRARYIRNSYVKIC